MTKASFKSIFYERVLIMVIDRRGFRAGVAVVLINKKNQVFWGKRIREDSWQFPQGGLLKNEDTTQAMFRELHEEVGLEPRDVEIMASSQQWLHYRFPEYMIRRYSHPVCIGQKQRWFLLRLIGDETSLRFNASENPEFDDYRWLYYWAPMMKIVPFKQQVYRQALCEFSSFVFGKPFNH
jgi:putative (di)nucleoside polyphosphate hydrolase